MGRKRSRVSGMSLGAAQNIAVNTVLPAVAGMLVADVLTKKIPFLRDNASTASIAKLAGGLLLATQGGMLGAAAIGMAISGGKDVIGPIVNKAGGVNLLPPGQAASRMSGLQQYADDNVRVTVQ